MNSNEFYQWCANPPLPREQTFRRPLLMGILNITPDSFADGGKYLNPEAAWQRANQMIAEGVDLIDIGGESSRPGAKKVSLQEELDRVLPVIQHIRAHSDICLSIDTYKPQVMRQAVAAGISWINDITALREEGALEVAAELNVPICLMHMQGTPQTMQQNPHYSFDLIDEINYFFAQRIEACLKVGLRREQFILDPGFGFGKTVRDNLLLVKRLSEFRQHGLPLLLGVSRKSSLGSVLGKEVHERLYGGLALTALAVMQGVSLIRTHDVAETCQVLHMIEAVQHDEIDSN